MAEKKSKKRCLELDTLDDQPLKLRKPDNDDVDDDEEDDNDDSEINLEESDDEDEDVEEPSLITQNAITSQLMAINSTLMFNKNLLLSNMAQSLMMQSSLLVI